MKEITYVPLRRRNPIYAVIDLEDKERIFQYRWFNNNGYASRYERVGNKRQWYYLHREILGCKLGDGLTVDHINGDTFDCRKSNLRIGTHADNLRNRRRANKNSTTGYRNVYWTEKDKSYTVAVSKNGVKYYGGSYRTIGPAIEVAARLRANLFGEWQGNG
jgi:hypothetical protein